MIFSNVREKAYVGPFAAFIALILLSSIVSSFGKGYSDWVLSKPVYWIMPLQTVLCSGLIIKYWKQYTLTPIRGWGWAIGAGLLSLVIWIAPQVWLGAAPRTDGFEPEFFGNQGWQYWGNLSARMFRLIIVVPLVEEIFWRGFLLRFLINDQFWKVPFGTFQWRAFLISSAAFCLEHQTADWPAALITGALFNLVAIRTKSLFACVLTHAITNAALGVWVLKTGQWGFW